MPRKKFLLTLEGVVIWGLAWLALVGLYHTAAWVGAPVESPFDENGILSAHSLGEFPFLFWGLTAAGILGVPLLADFLLHKKGLADFGLRRPTGGIKEVAIAAAFLIALVGYSRLLMALRYETLPGVSTREAAALLILPCALTAFLDEFLYRGYIQRKWVEAWGPIPGLVIASVFFALVGHYRAPLIDNLLLRLPAGLALGALFLHQRSLIGPILVHTGYNFAIVLSP